MTDRQILEQILAEQKAIRQEQVALRDDVKNLDLKVEVVNKQVGNAEHNLSAKIDQSQEDTIDALKALLLPPLDSHEERITALEEEVGIKPRKH